MTHAGISAAGVLVRSRRPRSTSIQPLSLTSSFDISHRLAEYIESEPLRKKAAQEAQRAKLEALEKKLGITPGGSSSDAAAGKKHRLDDTEYIEQSREIVDSVKSAVSVGEFAWLTTLSKLLISVF